MYQLINGEWTDDEEYDGDSDLEPTRFRDRVENDPDATFPAEADRYHLYVSWACPWSHRAILARQLNGLTDAITMDVLDPSRADDGAWQFTPEREGATPDTANGFEYLYEVYQKADPNVTGRVSVPVLWDAERETIVNNESREILRMLDTEFGEVAGRDVDLYLDEYREEIERTIGEVHDSINEGVYRVGCAQSQDEYDEAVADLFDALDYWESVLSEQRYLAGNVLTEADVCMFPSLIRFDHVYHTHFKCNRKRIIDYPNLWGYLRDLYGTPGVATTVDLDHIKKHYYTTQAFINPTGIVATRPNLDFDAPHDRDRFEGGPPEGLSGIV